MADVKKYSVIERLKEADDTLQGSPSLLGITSLTYPNYINAMRSVMFTSHIKQFVTLVHPETPYVFTNNENLVGKYSAGYKKAKNKYTIVRKIEKFSEITDSPKIYLLFVFDKKHKKFDVIKRKVCENLTENFGYEYKNQVIDSYKEGDTIEEGEVYERSTSYDDDMNYGYGRNVTVAYTLDPFTSEDAAVPSKSLCDKFISIETDVIKIGLNDNEFLLNIYGDKNHYIPLPKIGSKVSDLVAVTRKKYNNQILYDFKDTSLREIEESDDIYYIDDNSEIIDYDIYDNSEEWHNSEFYDQINDIIKAQNRYYRDIINTCKEIFKSGYEYSREIDYYYKRACEMVDRKKKWKDGDNEFSNMKIEIQYIRHVPLAKGCKITGRYGNKSVVSEIRDDDEMPYTEDGRRVDLMLNLLAIINRTTSFVLFEMYINGSSYKIRREMKKMKTLEEKENMLFEYIKILNEHQAKEFYKDYSKLDKEHKEAYIEDAIENGIYIHQVPMWEDKAMFYKAQELRRKFPFITMDKLYINKWGHKYPMLQNYFVGEMYCMKLKQSDRRGFSARSTGSIDMKSLPTRSFKSKSHLERTSNSCIRFGEFETLNFSIGVLPEDIALFHALYRTSIKGRKDLVSLMFSNQADGIEEIDKSYTSRVAEIFNVTLKSMGIGLDFIDDDEEIKPLSNSEATAHTLNGVTYICTDYQFYLMKRLSEIREEVLLENPIITTSELEKKIEEKLSTKQYLLGEMKENIADMHLNIEAEDKAIEEKIRDREISKEMDKVEDTINEVNIEEVPLNDK